jgi:tetratricopeptide (TPR) repeat protein
MQIRKAASNGIDIPRRLWLGFAPRRRARRGAFLLICFAALSLGLLSGGVVAQSNSPEGAIAGHVLDSAGKPVPDATVLLTGVASERASTDSSGAFHFTNLAPGRYELTANTTLAGSASDGIDVAPGEAAAVELRLNGKSASNEESHSSASLAQAMQFADDPHFTIAGVTDWTAAGGHGSDASLRTSEALTRETLRLQPGNRNTQSSSATCAQNEAALRSGVADRPSSFAANRCLGMFYLQTGKYSEAVASLHNAYRLQPADADNEYALAEAYEKSGDPARARDHIQKLLAQRDTADLHRLAGEVNESLGDPITAVKEFADAARKDPSEKNYFAWGSELLYHRAVWQARDVFEEGSKAWPKSARMLTALGAALFAGALYDDAAQRLCQAANLDPQSTEPYLFMGRIEVAAPNPLPCVAQKLADFHKRQPGNALADYYYAMALWKQQPSPLAQPARQQITQLLQQAIGADAGCGEAYLQLGNLQAQSGDYASAIPLYSQAIHAKPQLTESYYRLGLAYDRIGQRDKAQVAFAQHERLEKEQAAAVEKQRREIKQFVVVSSAEKNASAENRNH